MKAKGEVLLLLLYCHDSSRHISGRKITESRQRLYSPVRIDSKLLSISYNKLESPARTVPGRALMGALGKAQKASKG